MHWTAPTIDLLARAPERAALSSLEVALHLAAMALRAALPDLNGLGPDQSPDSRLVAIAEVLLTQITATVAVLHRYQELDDRRDACF
jgi:hypothetical protein